jgi:NAD(P)-dependent dehydrogenase (short-subunit alcohol dehydrogenase family)
MPSAEDSASRCSRLTGRVTAVIGAGSGMGRAIACRFASEGAHVVAADRDLDAATETVQLIAKAGGTAQAERVDATDLPDMKRLFDAIKSEHGLLHVLHNQVGGPSPTGRDISEAEFDAAVALNMKSAF